MPNTLNAWVEACLQRLPETDGPLTPDDLLRAGLPDFLVQRIRLELEHNLADSIRLPDSEWADMHATAVQDAWYEFLLAIRGATRIPPAYLRPVLETALDDVHEQLTAPLQAIPDFLFGPHAEMGYDELKVRAAWVSAYPHLAQALVRHLERNGRTSCTKAEATRLIAAVDAKWTEGYTALKWGQLLDPWFQLAPEGLDGADLSRFFSEKGLMGPARVFADQHGPVSKSTLIEILSDPYLDEQPTDDSLQLTADSLQPEEEELPLADSREPSADSSEPSADSSEPSADEVPIWQQFAVATESDDDARPLLDLLADEKALYVDALFGGDENAFITTVNELVRYEGWPEAGRHIRREILDRNRIDLESDEAIGFVDRVQTYFLQRQA